MAEEWRPIPGYERYEVSSYGRVRSLWFRNGHAEFVRDVPKVLRPHYNADGYAAVQIGPKARGVHIHRLVLLAFVGPPPEGCECGHSDGNPGNNSISNLAWVTRKQNNGADKVRHGRSNRGSANGNARLTDEQVVEIISIGRSITRKELARQYGVSPAVIISILSGRTWSHVVRPQLAG